MIELPRITIIAIDCYNYGLATAALQKCNEQVKAARTVLLTDIPLEIDGIEVVKIPTISSKEQYSEFCIKELYKYFDTDFVLVVQHDGYILSGEAWDNEFYNYDYIGAPWLYVDGKNVGNGGFSLRSKKLQKALGKDDFIKASDPEDQAIGRLYRDYLIKEYDIKFPSEKLADKFSFELREPSQKTFGFHGNFHQPYSPTVILKRAAALGDCLILEPVMRYYAMKGYNVVLDIPLSFFDLYTQHYFPVKHISKFDKGRIKPEKEVNLDLAYEVKPRQNYLKSYFEFCGVTDYELTRPTLYPLVDAKTKMFKKYAVVHIDERETTHRNVFGVKWDKIQRHLEAYGYTVIQIGKGGHDVCGIEINTPSVGYMKFLIAGCDLFIGIDSAPAGIAVAYNKPCILFFGSVNPDYIHPDLTGVHVIQQKCTNQNCWHIEGGTNGVPCIFDEQKPPCCITSTEEVIDSINKMHRV